MKNLALVVTLVAGLGLAGCASAPQVVTRQKLVAVSVPATLYNCPQVSRKNLPELDTLTDVQFARVVNMLWSNNQTCANSLKAIKSYLAKASRTVNR